MSEGRWPAQATEAREALRATLIATRGHPAGSAAAPPDLIWDAPHAYWFFGNLYETVVDVPQLMSGAQPQRASAVVVADQMDLEVLGDVGVDLGEEFAELDRPVAAVQAGDHGAVGGVERREQARGAVTDVVVGAFLGHPGHHRKRRLGPRQRLDLRLLVDAEDHGGLGRVEVEPHDVVDLLHEQRVVGELEPVLSVGLEVEGPPDPPDRRAREPAALGHLRPRPVRGVARCRLQRGHHHVLDLLGADRRRPARSRLVDQPVEAVLDEPGPPLTHRRRRTPDPVRDRRVVQAVGARQHDPRPQCQRLGRRRPTRPAPQLFTLVVGQDQLDLRTSCPRHIKILPLNKRISGAGH